MRHNTPTEDDNQLVSQDVDEMDEDLSDDNYLNPRNELTSDLQRVKQELESLGFEYDIRVSDGKLLSLSFNLPAGRSKRKIYIAKEAISSLVEINLAAWKSLEKYDGVWNENDGTIAIRLRASDGMSLWKLRRLINEWRDETFDYRGSTHFDMKDPASGLAIRVGVNHSDVDVLLRGRNRTPLLSMTVSNTGIQKTADADELIELLVDSVSFDFLVSYGVSLLPQRLESRVSRELPHTSNSKKEPSFPVNAYPRAAIALYQAGRDRFSSPLIRYWAYYQVLEYFFPRFSQDKAVRQLSRLLRNPGFDPHSNDQILKAVDLAVAVSKGHGSEEEQLYTTISSIVDSTEITELIDDLGIGSVLSKRSEISQKTVKTSDRTEVLQQLSQRIYDIRCSIVHSKHSNSRTSGPGLLPGTHHDDFIASELPLIEYLARQALFASAERLVLSNQSMFIDTDVSLNA